MSVQARFMEKASRTEAGCLEWNSTMHRDGYGKFWFDGSNRAAHRVSYLLFVGEIPEGKMVCHTCDNRKCVEPTHLYAGTASQNVRDKVERFKGMWGFMKIPFEKVQEAKRLYATGLSQQRVADMLGIDQTTVSKFVRGTSRVRQ